MSEIEHLIREALGRCGQPYSVDIIDEVLGKIQHDPDLYRRYESVLADYKARGNSRPVHAANAKIGSRVRQITGLPILKKGNPCKKNTLAKTYTQLG